MDLRALSLGWPLALSSRETLIKSVESPSGAKAPAWYQTFTDGLKAVPFKQLDLIRVSLERFPSTYMAKGEARLS